MKDRLRFFKKKGFWFFAIIPIILLILSPLISLQFLRYDVLESGSEFCFRGFFFPTAGYSVQADFDFADSDFSFTRLCFTPSELLESKQDYGVSVNFLNFYLKNLAISSNPYPRISLFSKQGEYHPNGTVFYKMSSLNTPFTYYLASNEKESECRLSGEHLLCALADLDLNQGQEYDLELWGKYSHERVKSFHSLTIQTPQAVLVEGSSMGEGDVFFSAVDDFEIYFNKDVVLHMDVFLQDQMEGDIPFVIDLVGKDLKIKVLDGIDVGTSAKFTLKNVYGMDGSFLEDEFVLNFSVLEVRR